MRVDIKIKKLLGTAIIPTFGTAQAAGFDFYAAETIVVPAKQKKIIPTGLAMEIPEGYEVQVRPRSGTSLKTSLLIANSPGTIDADYRGPIGIIVYNHGDLDYTVSAGERIAQGVLAAVPCSRFIEVEELGNTSRGSGGFGSTGK
jgi:dUTP pyrophosphatase